MTAFRAGNGKFVKRDNPLAVIGALQARKDATDRANALDDRRARRTANLRAHGVRPYDGPRTRAELAASAALREL
jgi:hypothetical protein